MIMRKPAHKDVNNPPAQTTYGFDRYPYLPKTLGEIIDRVNKQEGNKEYKYKDFNDWFGDDKDGKFDGCIFNIDDLIDAFRAAREMTN